MFSTVVEDLAGRFKGTPDREASELTSRVNSALLLHNDFMKACLLVLGIITRIPETF